MATRPKTDVTLTGDDTDADGLHDLNRRIADEAAAATTAEARAKTTKPAPPGDTGAAPAS
jgi:hypothetical protein